MCTRLAVSIFALAVIKLGMLPVTGLATTRSASFAVTVTVEARCQVNAAAKSGSVPGRWNQPVAVNCSLPVPYLVGWKGGAATDNVGPVSSEAGSAEERSGSAGPWFGEPRNRRIETIEAPASGRAESMSSVAPAGVGDIEQCQSDRADSGVITVTVDY